MKRLSKVKVIIAFVLIAVIALSTAIVIAPSADKNRIDTIFLTDISAENWVDESVYNDGTKITEISLNGTSVEAGFQFKTGDTITFNAPVNEDEYNIGFVYSAENVKPVETLFTLSVGEENYNVNLPQLWQDNVVSNGRYPKDRYGNEMANTQTGNGGKIFNPLYDNRDINLSELKLKLNGQQITIKNDTQDINIYEIWVYKPQKLSSYDEYLKANGNKSDNALGIVTIQGEDFSLKSDSFIRSANVNNINLTPYNTYKRMINTLEGSSFDTAGQKVVWEFETGNDGWYEIGLKFCQNSASNKKVHRKIEIDGIVPFAEMEEVAFNQTSNATFKTEYLSSGKDNYKFYLTKGRHTIALTAKMSSVTREIYYDLMTLIDDMNALGMDITKLTAGVTDKNRTWDINSYLPTAVDDMKNYIVRLDDIYERLEKAEGETPTYADGLKTAAKVLEKLLKSPRKIPNKLELFNTGDNSAVKHIRNVVSKMTGLYLGIDEIYFKAEKEEHKSDKKPFTTSLSTAFKRFFFSLTPEAKQNAVGTADEDALDIWMSRSSIYVQVLQGMADSAKELDGMKINISIMPNEQKLVLASAAGTNPDAVIGAAMGTPFKFALRGAAKDLTDFSDFLSFYDSQYNLEGLVPCAYDGGVYGAVETQDYNVLFYRKDILDSLGISVPDTWDDVKEIMPTLLRYNKNMSLPIANVVGFKSFGTTSPYIYQNNGEFYSENGINVAFLEEETIKGFEEMTELFRIYAVEDYVPSFYNSFRNGTTPLGLGGVSMFVQLSEAAPEIAGLWDIAPAPGVKLSDGSVVRDMNSAQTACMIFKNSDKHDEAWKFLKWWLSAETQATFASTMELSYGTEYKWNTANLIAFEEGTYSEAHKKVIKTAWQNQKETIQHPASYIVEREISNAYTNVVVNGDTVIEALEKSTLVSNREIARKLKEFGFFNEDGTVNRNYPVKVLEDIYAKLNAQKGDGKQ